MNGVSGIQGFWQAIAEGRLVFASGVPVFMVLLLVVLVPLLVWYLYGRTTRPLTQNDRIALTAMRSMALVMLLLMLLRPVIQEWETNPQETYLAILVDDSQSMQINDGSTSQQSRIQAVQNALSPSVLSALREQYQLRTFAFGRDVRRLNSPNDLTAADNRSDISTAISHVGEQLGSLPLNAVVVISDGGDNSNLDPATTAEVLGGREVPVFTVGVGQPEVTPDIAIRNVRSDATLLDSEQVDVELSVSQTGFAADAVQISIWDGDTQVASRQVALGNDGETRRYTLPVVPDRNAAIRYEARIETLTGERLVENNRYQFLVDNSLPETRNILYVDGHPRNEFKFIRRALDADDDLRLASYLQTGPGRFYRQGVENALELSTGFPEDKETLYAYEGLLIGDVELDFFSEGQLGLIRDFVAERGGGLLVSGMVDDAFIDTPLSDVLPLELVRSNSLPGQLQGGIRRGAHATGTMFTPVLTTEGEFANALRLGSSDSENRTRWQDLPELQGIYVTGQAKAGATVLLEHPDLQYQRQPLPVLATQRYGSGRSVALTTASTWRWQMLMPSEDDSHERLWRQMARWLTDEALARVKIELNQESYHAGDEVDVSVRVRDNVFELDNNASVWLQVTMPNGEIAEQAMSWDINDDGTYRATLPATDEGVYQLLVDVTSTSGDGATLEQQGSFAVTPSLREYNDAGLDRRLLQRVSGSSGGRYYELSELDSMLTDLASAPTPYARQVDRDIWHHAFWLGLLLLMLFAEWAYRRYRGLS
ncbi:hypothetical protein [Pseudohongiella nitratireducens]|uniref:hypothetical protein n=1 Tax=Pseudohongiella nitratireducens TaxID=1768907 RepID=UPI0030EC00D4|tara:strand:+ start:4175 stop:6478 length:2304 start_codon:yes stop_codon:yes gene_type:complete